ncbi:hypothetical protein [Methylobacterium sp. WL120]|nr:hypothetical protein [Methylobacterium sp. WL120]
MSHAHWQSIRSSQAVTREQRDADTRAFLQRRTVQPQSHRRILRSET